MPSDHRFLALVALIYKKGDPADCDNYRPICLLSIGYKLFAAMLKQRIFEEFSPFASAEKLNSMPLTLNESFHLTWDGSNRMRLRLLYKP